MSWMRCLTVLCIGASLGLGCGEKEAEETGDTNESGGSDTADSVLGGNAFCTCEDPSASLTAVSGCENFGGDEELCSGWRSCEEENGLSANSTHEDGTQLTCFGCTIQISCN